MRLGAFLVDVVVLGVIGWIVGSIFYEVLIGFTWESRIIGAVITGAYVVVLNSHIGNGSTLGKRIFKLQVLGVDGRTISLQRSAVRYVVLFFPFFMNGIQLPANVLSNSGLLAVSGTALSVLIFGTAAAIVYLVVFNKRNRRSLHDLVSSTVVVRRDNDLSSIDLRVAKVHVYALGVLLTTVAVLPAVFLARVDSDTLESITDVYEDVRSVDGVIDASVWRTKQWFDSAKSDGSTVTYITVSARLSSVPEDPKQKADSIYSIVQRRPESLDGTKAVVVSLNWGFDIGIASQYATWTEQYPN